MPYQSKKGDQHHCHFWFLQSRFQWLSLTFQHPLGALTLYLWVVLINPRYVGCNNIIKPFFIFFPLLMGKVWILFSGIDIYIDIDYYWVWGAMCIFSIGLSRTHIYRMNIRQQIWCVCQMGLLKIVYCVYTWWMQTNKSLVLNKHPLTFAQLSTSEGTL